MPTLNYLGSAPTPGVTMPGGIPGAGGPSDPSMPASMAMGMPGGGPPPPMGGGMPGPAPAGPGGIPPVGMTDPAGQNYEAVTQVDGTVLLHIRNPDGSRGPAVKIIPAIKPKTQSQPGQGAM